MCNLSMGLYEEDIAEAIKKTAINRLKKNMDIATIMKVT